MKKRISGGLIFLIGWILSPFTWWNDAFVNIPLSYLMANVLFCVTHLSFKWLVLVSYWITNILGLFFMYFGGKKFILKSQDKLKATVALVIMLIIYSAIMVYLGEKGMLKPLETYFKRFCIPA